MGHASLTGPLMPPHRRAAWAGAVDVDTDKEIEAMLPKDILKYAEKVKDVEAEVLKELKKQPTPLSRTDPFFVPGQMLQASQLEQLQRAAQAQQQYQGGLRGLWDTTF